MRWDIFCTVIDNHGDLGVCWRLSADLAARGEQVRLWVDDATALDWMAPGAREGRVTGITVHPWRDPLSADDLAGLQPAQVWVEAFGCELPAAFVAHFSAARAGEAGHAAPVWLNLEYLSTEAYVERCHGLPSPVMHGPGRGHTKWFFYPGVTARTGGLLREPDLPARQAAFDRSAWRTRRGLPDDEATRHISLFCYEPPALGDLLARLAQDAKPTQLLVTAGRATAATQAVLGDPTVGPRLAPGLALSYLPPMPQTEFDQLLWSCALNFVRGEDSVVRALWAGAPLVWQIYPQHDNAHHDKLLAFLDWLDAPPSLREFHLVWNGVRHGPLPALDLPLWGDCIRAARARLLVQDDLTTQLLSFISEKH